MHLQARFDQEAEEFFAESVSLLHEGKSADRRITGSLMQSQVERFDEAVRRLLASRHRVGA